MKQVSIIIFASLIFLTISVQAQPVKEMNFPVKLNTGQSQNIHQVDPGVTIEDFKPVSYTGTRVTQRTSTRGSGSFVSLPNRKPGVAFLSSAIVPGLGQAFNGKWARAGAYFTAEVLGIVYHIDRENKARRQERRYEQFADNNWSVVAYSEWLVNYYDANNLNHPKLDELRSMIEGVDPTFSTDDWNVVNRDILISIERDTPFIFDERQGGNFSHILPAYGTQQYYELVSKYFQFQSGWKEFYEGNTRANDPLANPAAYRYNWNGTDAFTNQFFSGANMAERFNDNYRAAGNLVTLLIVNHVVSAFDAYFTVKLQNSRRVSTDVNLLSSEQVSLTYHF